MGTVRRIKPFDNFVKEETHEAIVMRRLEEYIIARDQEHYAIALAKTYNRRRQSAYKAYLKEYDALQNTNNLSDEIKRVLEMRLNNLNQYRKP